MKYELTMNTKTYLGKTFYQIKALKDFGDVKTGDLGGWVASEGNLSQEGGCWVYGDAIVSGDAVVYGNALVFGNAIVSGDAVVYGNALVYGNAMVSGNALVFGNAMVSGSALVSGDAKVSGNAEVYGNAVVSGNAKVSGNAWVKRGEYKCTPVSITRSDGYAFTLQSDMSIVAGCRDFTKEESEEHWGNPKHHMHKESWAIVQSLWAIAEARNVEKETN